LPSSWGGACWATSETCSWSAQTRTSNRLAFGPGAPRPRPARPQRPAPARPRGRRPTRRR
jgi:hypothetical protein